MLQMRLNMHQELQVEVPILNLSGRLMIPRMLIQHTSLYLLGAASIRKITSVLHYTGIQLLTVREGVKLISSTSTQRMLVFSVNHQREHKFAPSPPPPF